MNNVHAMRSSNICMACGTCASSCPIDIIEMVVSPRFGQFRPSIGDGCVQCGKCLEACPALNHRSYANEASASMPHTDHIGPYIEFLVGHAVDHDVRSAGSSGGLITGLLVQLLREGTIDGALLVRMSQKDPAMTEVFLADDEDKILSASGSKYAPTPLNASLGLIAGQGRYAVVGLPCHLRGLDLLMAGREDLKRSVAVKIGLFCGHMATMDGIDFLLRSQGIEKGELRHLTFRGEGYPGSTVIDHAEGSISIEYQRSYGLMGSSFFFSSGCLYCRDQTNEAADLSFGDPWNTKYQKDREGHSLVVVRTLKGQEVLGTVRRAGAIQLEEIAAKEVVRSQMQGIHFKNRCVPSVKFTLIEDRVIKGAVLRGQGTMDALAHVQHRAYGAMARKPFVRRMLSLLPQSAFIALGSFGPGSLGRRRFREGLI